VRPPVKVVAVIAANPALSSILSAMLAASPGLRVRQFDSAIALETYMRLAPVDLLVCDFDCEAAPAGALALRLRHDEGLERHDFRIIALAGTFTPETRQLSVEAGIDEVIVKPMSPKYLLERVVALLRAPGTEWSGDAGWEEPAPARLPPAAFAAMAAHARRGDNIVPLFRKSP
jgi:DNA-binding response OmpR family regulator